MSSGCLIQPKIMDMKIQRTVLILFFSLPLIVAEERPEHVLLRDAQLRCQNESQGVYRSDEGNYCCMCPAGTFVKKTCKSNRSGGPTSRECQPCPFETYTEQPNGYDQCNNSLTQRDCQNFMNTRLLDGNRTMNGRCVCKDGHHSTATGSSDTSAGCHPHSSCNPGYQPFRLANKTHDTHCEICPNGTFSNISSLSEKCKPWKKCSSDEKIVEIGNRTRDTKCSSTGSTTMATSNSKPGGLSTGETVGIVIAVVAIVVLAIFCYCYREKLSSKLCCRHQGYKAANRGTQLTLSKASNSGDLEAGSGFEAAGGKNGRQDGQSRTSDRVDSTTMEQSACVTRGESSPIVSTQTGEKSASEKSSLDERSFITETAQTENEAGPLEAPNGNGPIIDFPAPDMSVFLGCELEKIIEKGCKECSLSQTLKDNKIAKAMLNKLLENEDTDTENLLFILRQLGLSDRDVTDLRKENAPIRENNLRQKMVSHVFAKRGTSLTPALILRQKFELQSLRESVFNEFLIHTD